LRGLSYTGSVNRRVILQASVGINLRSYLKKIPKSKRAGGMAQVVGGLPNKCEGLSSPNTENNNEKPHQI
jgi:hypothetical protein